ncbi:hypothetical protein RR48_00005 [Papilio machaon]|uniref:Uncharacterized protein n=1 Tax=Papilio machaon TaxID=76193 RepID=A0A0N1PIJ1_PAPMA|nr:hypothetical protein RR48_00005 [Papilio machaon]
MTCVHSLYAQAYDRQYGRRHEACVQRRERDAAAPSTELHCFVCKLQASVQQAYNDEYASMKLRLRGQWP